MEPAFPIHPHVSAWNQRPGEIHVDVLCAHRGHRLGIMVIVGDTHSSAQLRSHLICAKQSPERVPGAGPHGQVALLSPSEPLPAASANMCGSDICD